MKMKKMLIGGFLVLLVVVALFFLFSPKNDKNGGLKFVAVKKETSRKRHWRWAPSNRKRRSR